MRISLGLLLAIGTFAGTLLATAHGQEPSPFDPETGFRIAQYRAPTGAEVPGGTRIDIAALDRILAEERAILIDVMPSDGAGPDPTTGRWRLSKPRLNIPGSHWLADVGVGNLEPVMMRYFADNLARLTVGDQLRTIVLYCQSDCWMSWNAVKRAAGLGYKRLYWLADGTDGWRDFDRALVPAEPVPLAMDHAPESASTPSR